MLNMSKLSPAAASLCIAACASFAAAQALYSNASTDPAAPALALRTTTTSGVAAPGGGAWSEVTDAGVLAGANATAGIALHVISPAISFRTADDFFVSDAGGWTLNEAWVYVFAPGWATTDAPVVGATARLWTSAPTSVGAQVAWGDTTTNRLASCDITAYYRTFAAIAGPAVTPPDATRRIWRVRVNVPAQLPQGTYWLDVQLTPANAQTPIYIVPATLSTSRSAAGWNSLQSSRGAWSPVFDQGKPPLATAVPLDLAFMLRGTLGAGCDSIDFNRDGVSPDTADLTDLLSVFSGGPCSTGTCGDIDLNNDGVSPDSADIDTFLRLLSGGAC